MKQISYWSLIIISSLVLVSSSFAASGNELVNNAKIYDGQKVTFEGETIGDIMVRQDHAWLNVNDGTLAIGIWAPVELANKVRHTGSYRFSGDKIMIKGTFNRACQQHGGDLDIHASEITVLKEGYKRAHPINQAKVVIAIALLIGILILIVLPKLIR
ncbi:MAG: DNA-binding protein [bacterium]